MKFRVVCALDCCAGVIFAIQSCNFLFFYICFIISNAEVFATKLYRNRGVNIVESLFS